MNLDWIRAVVDIVFSEGVEAVRGLEIVEGEVEFIAVGLAGSEARARAVAIIPLERPEVTGMDFLGSFE